MRNAQADPAAVDRVDGYQRALDGIAEIVDQMAAAGRGADAQMIHVQVWKPLAHQWQQRTT
jgi:hypothetical protein